MNTVITILEESKKEKQLKKEELHLIFKTKNEQLELQFSNEFKEQIPYFKDWDVVFNFNAQRIIITHKEMLNKGFTQIIINMGQKWDGGNKMSQRLEIENYILRHNIDMKGKDLAMYYCYLDAQVILLRDLEHALSFELFQAHIEDCSSFIKEVIEIRELSQKINNIDKEIEKIKKEESKKNAQIVIETINNNTDKIYLFDINRFNEFKNSKESRLKLCGQKIVKTTNKFYTTHKFSITKGENDKMNIWTDTVNRKFDDNGFEQLIQTEEYNVFTKEELLTSVNGEFR